MQENFVIGIRKDYNYRYLYSIIASLIIAFVIIFPIMGIGSLTSILSFILLTLIIYVLITSMTNENLSNELPSTLYPLPPRMGLDGISLNSYIAGIDINH